MQTPLRNQSFQEIVADYRKHKLTEELHGEWAHVVFYRPLALILTWILTRTSIRPNQVTLVNAMVLPVMVYASFELEPGKALLTVCSLAVVYCILDCVDGSLARALHMQTIRGHYLDFAFDAVYRVCLYASLGHLADTPSAVLVGSVPAQPNLLCVGLIAAWISTFSRLCRVYHQLIQPSVAETQAATTIGARLVGFAFSAISGFDHTLPLLAVVCWWLDLLPPLMFWLVIYSLFDLASTQITILRSMRT